MNLKILAFIGFVIFIVALTVTLSYRSMQQQARLLDERYVYDDDKVLRLLYAKVCISTFGTQSFPLLP